MENTLYTEKQNKQKEPTGVSLGVQAMFKFLKDVSREMRKVSWPKGKELSRYTITVLSTVTFMAVFFALLDLGITKILDLFF